MSDLYDDIEKWYTQKGISVMYFFSNNSTEYARELIIEDFSYRALSEITALKERETKLVEVLKDLIVLAPQAHDFNDKCFYRGIPPNVEWFCGCGTDDKIKKCVEVLKELGVEL